MIDDKHMAASLIEKRRQTLREIVDLELQLGQRRDALGSLDNTIRFLDPDAVLDDYVPNRRLPQNDGHLVRGEISRRIRRAFRDARGEPITIETLALAVLTDNKLDPTDKRLLQRFKNKFQIALYALRRRGTVEKIGERRNVRWKLAADTD